LVLKAKVGDRVQVGTPLVAVHANDAARMAEARDRVAAAYRFGTVPPIKPRLIMRII
jgi:thymidine phosphorylase